MSSNKNTITDEQAKLVREWASNPVAFSKMFENLGIYDVCGTHTGAFMLDDPHQVRAVNNFIRHDKVINLWCHKSHKWTLEAVIMLWSALFHHEHHILYAEYNPAMMKGNIKISPEYHGSEHAPVTRMAFSLCKMYEALPDWFRELVPATYRGTRLGFDNASVIEFVSPDARTEYYGRNIELLVVHGVSSIPDDKFRGLMSAFLPRMFAPRKHQFKVLLSSEGGVRRTLFESLCKVSTDITENPDSYQDVNGWVLDVVRAGDLPLDELTVLLGGKKGIPEQPWRYEDEFK